HSSAPLMAEGYSGLGGTMDSRTGYEGGSIVGPSGFRYITGVADRNGGGNFCIEAMYSNQIAAFRLSQNAYSTKFYLHPGLRASEQSYPLQLGDPVEIKHTGNTTVDSNGFLKNASPILKLHSDRVETEAGGTFERLGTGHYRITGSNRLRLTDGWSPHYSHDKYRINAYNV